MADMANKRRRLTLRATDANVTGGWANVTTTHETQLTIDGGEVPFPLPRPRQLTERQRSLWLWAAMWPGREITTADAGRFFADPSGALRRLEAFGRVEWIGRGRWR